MKYALGLFFFLFFAAACVAQNTNEVCDLKSNGSPALFNLRLGMSPEDVQTVFGRNLKIKIKKNGNKVFFQNFIKEPAPPVLSGVRALYLRFFDGGLYQIEIFYEAKSGLKTLTSVTDLLSAQLNLPVAEWKLENNQARIICGDASLVADNILNPRVELTKETIRAEVERLREANKKK